MRRVKCRGGEVAVTWQNATGGDAVAETAKLIFSAAGHLSWSYDFTYEDGVLASARHRTSAWAFAGGNVDRPETRDIVVERRYALEKGKLTACTERRAEGPSDAIEGLVQDAPVRKTDCKHAEPIVALGKHAAQPIEDADTAWLDAACRSDRPSTLKL